MSAKLWVSVVFTSSLIIHLVSAAADDGEGRREISASIPALCCSPNLQVSCKRRTVLVIFIVLYSTSLVIIIELYVGKCYLVIHILLRLTYRRVNLVYIILYNLPASNA